MKFEHVMIDIETMGTGSFSAIVSIAAVRFDFRTRQSSESIYLPVSLQSCLDAGLKVDASTIMWWMEQNDEARRALLSDSQTSISSALDALNDFITDTDKVWGNSARFDLGLLENAYNILKKPIPWKYYNERDVRTLVAFAPSIKKEYPRAGIAHNALDDCKYQIGYCYEIYKRLNSNAL